MNTFSSSSLLASHVTYDQFRARDIKFFYELFSNWFATSAHATSSIQTIQIQRFLEKKLRSGEVVQKKGSRFHYSLTPVGVLSTLKEISNPHDGINPKEVYFRVYIISSYAPKIISLMEHKFNSFPFLVKDEIQSLLSVDVIIKNEIEKIDKAIRVFEERRDSALSCAHYVQKNENLMDFKDILIGIEENFPYEMNPVKPFSQLISELPENFQKYEVTLGMKNRAEMLWMPELESLKSYKKTLAALMGKLVR